LSAAFVHERLRRAFSVPPQAGYRDGGWGLLMDDLGRYARGLGVQMETSKRIDRLPPGPVIVATTADGWPTSDFPAGGIHDRRPTSRQAHSGEFKRNDARGR
jgi:hypothetical protein